MDNKEIRRANMLMLAEQFGSLRALGDATETPPAYLSQIKNRSNERGMGDDVARRFEEKLGKSRGWMDALQVADEPSRPMFSRSTRPSAPNTGMGPELKGKVPVISWVQAGTWASAVDNLHPGDAEEWAETTVPIHRHTYALRVKGDSMTNPNGEPTFPHGQVIIVEPDAIDAPDKLVGSFVIVRRNGDDEATFKQLVRDGGHYLLKPLNPQYPMLELKETDEFCGVVREKVVRFF
jgi:SOS-response transcriptional repressor LexA